MQKREYYTLQDPAVTVTLTP